MKKNTLIKAGLLALAVTVLCAPAAKAQTVSAGIGDLIMGLRATGGTGQTENLEINLGNVSTYYNAAPGTSFAVTGLSNADLVAIYGASWNTRDDLFWGAMGTDGRGSGTPDGHAGKSTIWATRAEVPFGTQSTPWNTGSVNAQANASSLYESMFSGGPGILNGAAHTANSLTAADINASLAGSWSSEELFQAGLSFAQFSPSIDGSLNIGPSGHARLDLYEMKPFGFGGVGTTTSPGTYLGYFDLSGDGAATFTAVPEPSTFASLGLGLGLVMMGVRRRRLAKA